MRTTKPQHRSLVGGTALSQTGFVPTAVVYAWVCSSWAATTAFWQTALYFLRVGGAKSLRLCKPNSTNVTLCHNFQAAACLHTRSAHCKDSPPDIAKAQHRSALRMVQIRPQSDRFGLLRTIQFNPLWPPPQTMLLNLPQGQLPLPHASHKNPNPVLAIPMPRPPL